MPFAQLLSIAGLLLNTLPLPGTSRRQVKGSRKNNFTFCCRLRSQSAMEKIDSMLHIQEPAALRGAAAGGHLRRCRPPEMKHIACVAAPGICPPGARAKM